MNPATFEQSLRLVMRRLAVLLVCLPALVWAQADPLPMTFLPGGAGAEGCYAQWSTRSEVRAYSAPTEGSRLLRTIDAERRIDANDFSESLTAVLRPGAIRTRVPMEVSGVRVSTGAPATLQVPAGGEVAILAYGPEESVFFGIDGRVYSGFVQGYLGSETVEVLRRPVTELWVRLVEHDAERPAAWVNTAQAGMAPREPFCE